MKVDAPESEQRTADKRRRLAIVGCGSSGLICLKTALDELQNWDVVCFEKSGGITGCWGKPYPGFVSTSTKYTTQFACFPIYDASVHSDGGKTYDEFFCEDEYGRYLERFADEFSLRKHIVLHCNVDGIQRVWNPAGWELTLRREAGSVTDTCIEQFDCVIVCTGLAAEPKSIDSDVGSLSLAELNSPEGLGHVTDKRIVVIGGGESAVDFAYRLSRPHLRNQVFLSLQSGIRVSPRYHPIRGVPSDFLRNRLMLSIHEDMRNWIGQRFVELRIRYQERFEWLFPPSNTVQHFKQTSGKGNEAEKQIRERRKQWSYWLTKAAKDDLFNMFHNKSDTFLDAVAYGEITIVGPPVDSGFATCQGFSFKETVATHAELLVPAVGFRSTLETMSFGALKLADFFMGCCHITYSDLYLVGFARPIIGNIPTISEMQARYVCGLIGGRCEREPEMKELHAADMARHRTRFSKLNLAAIYPVEMFPYCDRLSKSMGVYPSLDAIGSLASWLRIQLTPATTLHYQIKGLGSDASVRTAPIYMPWMLIGLLMMLKPIDWLYRLGIRSFALWSSLATRVTRVSWPRSPG